MLVDAVAVAGPAGAAARSSVATLPLLHVPAMFDAEVAAALRAMVRWRRLSEPRARAALRRAGAVQRRSYPFAPFAERVWELRHNVTVYDGWYVALAEWLDAPLLTADERLARATGPRCAVQRPR